MGVGGDHATVSVREAGERKKRKQEERDGELRAKICHCADLPGSIKPCLQGSDRQSELWLSGWSPLVSPAISNVACAFSKVHNVRKIKAEWRWLGKRKSEFCPVSCCSSFPTPNTTQLVCREDSGGPFSRVLSMTFFKVLGGYGAGRGEDNSISGLNDTCLSVMKRCALQNPLQ